MNRILCVCLGNICRSPMAQGVLNQIASTEGLNIVIDSAGTAGYHIDEKPDDRSIIVAKKFGVDITNQRARKFKLEDFEMFDLILVMDRQNLKDVLQLAPNTKAEEKVKLYRFDSLDVDDPYYGGEEGFTKMYHVLREHAMLWIDYVKLKP
jgi:protein-tyrosine phosphatase